MSAIYEGGIEKGAWEDEGLEMSFGTSSGSQESAQAVGNGQDDFSNPEVNVALQFIEEGMPIRIVGNISNRLDGIISLADAGIETWTDLEGKTLGVFPWGQGSDLALEALRKQGGDPDKVNLENIQPDQQETLLIAGEVDAVSAYYPQSSVRLRHEGYQVNTLAVTDVLNNLGNVMIAHEDLVEDEPEIVEKFVAGWLQSHKLYIQNVDDFIDTHKKGVAEFNEEVERKTLPYIFSSWILPDVDLDKGMGWLPETHLENTISVLEDIDFLEQTVATDEYYTNEFVGANEDLALETAELYDDTIRERYDISPDRV